jgi:hypothetical protein
VRSAGRVPSTPEGLDALAESLLRSDRVALEVTGSCWEFARILEPHVERVIVVSPDDTGIASARAKTDKLDSRTLATLLWKGELDAVWVPDERCRVLRRRLARREQLLRARTRSKNEIQATLQRRLVAKPPFADLFGVTGRRWLADLELPVEERESVDAGLRHIGFTDSELAAVDRLIARQALSWPEIRRLMTVPGVNLIVPRRSWPRSASRLGSWLAASWWPISGWIRRCVSPARHWRARGGSPTAGQLPRGRRWSKRHGVWSNGPGHCAGSMRAPAPDGVTARRSSRPPASSRSCSGACSAAVRITPTSGPR